jgi:hypothetical protein
MPPSGRRGAGAILADFAGAHRGVRIGSLFGRPAAYAGRRVFARASERGLDVKLPPAAREAAVRAGLAARGPVRRGGVLWTTFAVTGHMPQGAVHTYLEIAARHVAERPASDLTGQVRRATSGGTPAKRKSRRGPRTPAREPR